MNCKNITSARRFFVENLGCAKNQVDAETIISFLENAGWIFSSADEADLIIINTCGFIQSAKEESIETTISYRETYPDKKIILAGCLAQRYGKELEKSLDEVDGIFGNKSLGEIVKAADNFIEGKKRLIIPPEPLKENTASCSISHQSRFSFPGSAYVKIAEGCNNNCTFCAIPIIRGTLKSRLEDSIIDEIKKLTDNGIFEINLIAQDLASWGLDRKEELTSLIEKITKIKGDFWLRLLYMHPDRFNPALLDIMAEDRRVIPYFDLPFQHASKEILSQMGRKGDSESYLALINNIREKMPHGVLRSTFLVGFPGEKEADYKILKRFIEKARLDWAGFFNYSREEGTKAFHMKQSSEVDSEEAAIKKAEGRVSRLKKLQTRITEENLERFTGETLDILIEEIIPEEELSIGRSYINAPEVDGSVVVLSGDVKPGQVIKCKITRRNSIDLEAAPL